MSALLPQFGDHRVCNRCGAPVEIIGEPWLKDGVEDWYAKPRELPVRDEDRRPRHPKDRSRKRKSGMSVETERYQVQVFTHLCTRIPGRDRDGKPTDDKRLEYGCDAVMVEDTKVVPIDAMPPWCFRGML